MPGDGGLSFRTAHHVVGRAVGEAVERNTTSLTDVLAGLQTDGDAFDAPAELNAKTVVDATIYGGGRPGRSSLDACLEIVCGEWHRHAQRKREQARKWQAASSDVEDAAVELCHASNDSRLA